jgi:hypothetical protein
MANVHDLYHCPDGRCGYCPSCCLKGGYMLPDVAIVDPTIDMVGKYSYADLMIELFLNK